MHAPIDQDYIEILLSSSRPSDPYRGQQIFETDTNSFVGRTTADTWANINMLADPPACRVFHNAAQTIPDAGSFTPAFNSTRYDTDNMHDPAVNNSRITFNTPGLYMVGFGWDLTASNDYTLILVGIIATGSTTGTIADFSQQHNVISANVRGSVVTTFKFAAGDYIQARVYADNTAGAGNRQILASPPFSPEFWATWIGRG